MFKRTTLIIVFVLITLILSSCLPWMRQPTQDPGLIGTIAMQTAVAQLTRSALETSIARSTLQTLPTFPPTWTPTAVQPTATFGPTATPLPPTATPTRTPVPATRTPTEAPTPCDWVGSVKDISIPDGEDVNSQQTFTKIWRLKNTGDCTWTTSYALVFVSGNAMGGPASQKLQASVKPGETIDVSVDLVAPKDAGTYTGYWMLRNSQGKLFGVGANADNSFWVKIDVLARTPTQPTNYAMDFVYNFCSAVWKSTEGSLDCPGNGSDFDKGSISRLNNPVLEGNYQDNEPALLTIPSDGTGGMISGRYAAYKVKSGDHFKAVIGCLYNSTHCDVMFQLNYIADNGSIQNLKSWTEVYDGNYTKVDVDLSSLVDKSVQFILVVQNNGDSVDDRAFWLAPRIVH